MVTAQCVGLFETALAAAAFGLGFANTQQNVLSSSGPCEDWQASCMILLSRRHGDNNNISINDDTVGSI